MVKIKVNVKPKKLALNLATGILTFIISYLVLAYAASALVEMTNSTYHGKFESAFYVLLTYSITTCYMINVVKVFKYVKLKLRNAGRKIAELISRKDKTQ